MRQSYVQYCCLMPVHTVNLKTDHMTFFFLSATKAPVVVVTTGQSGYTVVSENKTETVPKVQEEGPSGIIAVVTAVIVAVVLIAVFSVSIRI